MNMQLILLLANGENCSGGFGLNQKNFRELVDCGIDAFTMGNHMWDNRDIYNFIDHEERLVRPANFRPVCLDVVGNNTKWLGKN